MKDLFLLLDQLTALIPPRLLPLLRWGAIGGWLFLAFIVALYSWQWGEENATRRDEDAYLRAIRQQALKKRNLEARPDIVVPDVRALVTEERYADEEGYEEGSRSHLYDSPYEKDSYETDRYERDRPDYPYQGKEAERTRRPSRSRQFNENGLEGDQVYGAYREGYTYDRKGEESYGADLPKADLRSADSYKADSHSYKAGPRRLPNSQESARLLPAPQRPLQPLQPEGQIEGEPLFIPLPR